MAARTADPPRDACFDCSICMERATEPVVTQCGHMFCWSCLVEWIDTHETCPDCKATCTRETLIPVYGKGRDRGSHPSSAPPRPRARRPPSPPRRRNTWGRGDGGGVHLFFGHPLLLPVLAFGNGGIRIPPLQIPEWNDELKSKLCFFAGCLLLMYLVLIE